MESSKQLAKRFQEVLLNGKWIANINFKEALQDLDWKEATHKIGSLNTLAALTFHVNYYINGVAQVLQGGPLDIRDKYSFDLQEIKSQEDWENLLNELLSNAEKFAHLLEALPDHKLDEDFVDKKYGDYRRNIEGMIEHCYYHLGQISLIKKMVLESGN